MSNSPVIKRLCWLLLMLLLAPGTGLASGSEALRRYVEGLGDGGAEQYGITNVADIISLYADNQNQLLWFGAGPLASMRAGLIQAIQASAGHGFEPARYHYQNLVQQVLPQAVLEVLFTDALLSQIRHRSSGVLGRQEQEWFIARPAVDAPGMLRMLAAERPDIHQLLQRLWPQHQDYQALVARREALSQQADVYTQIVTAGPLLRQGDRGPRVQQLQNRLLGPGEHGAAFDPSLTQAVKAFQQASGLEADGIVGDATLEVLNANRFSWIDRIDANLERWRWLPRQLPDTYILVNIAAFRLRAISADSAELAMDIIVGRPYRQTPIFTETLKYLVFFPYWNVPTNIAVKDKLPLLRTDPGPLALSGYEARLPGSDDFEPVDSIDWRPIKPGYFLLRQRPGEQNALGKVKFMLPNVHDVYLHDTPEKGLFSKAERIFSSGCIRLADAMGLVEWVLRQDRNSQLVRARRLYESGPTTTVYLDRPIPVYLVYFTAFVDDAEVRFRRDVYERDRRIINELNSTVVSP